MFRFGFELEGFYFVEDDQEIRTTTIPPKSYPHDDFPGLVEVRTTGGGDLRQQLYLLLAERDRYPDVSFIKCEHKFTPQERAKIRARHYEKGGVTINNIYGKSPKDIGSKTLASFQINISNFLGSGDKGRDYYGLFDFVDIVRRLDVEFEAIIGQSGRQPGFYSVKDNVRLEYRSLPNMAGCIHPNTLIERIQGCLR